jgi:hypothetical protein
VTSSSTNVDIIAALESLIGCGGWCPLNQDQPSFDIFTYRFRNINDCTDSRKNTIYIECLANLQNCYEGFKNFMTDSGRTVGFGCLGAVLVCFLNIIAVCCLCCHPSKTKKGSEFYSRMVGDD